MWENREFRIKLEEDSMRNYERIMLMSGECSFFMPMGFVGEEDGDIVCYECSGFAPLSYYKIEKTEDALYILESVLLIIGKSVEYFITPARIMLTEDTVFYNKDTGQVKIAYVPLKCDKTNIRENIHAFIKQLEVNICDGHKKYLCDAEKYIMQHNYYIRDMVNKVGMLKRLLYIECKEEAS